MSLDGCSNLIAMDKIWQEFMATNMIASGAIPPSILSSWQRCREAGVDPHDGISHQLLNDVEIQRLFETRQAYIDIVRHFMSHLYEFVKGLGFIVLLADERGYVMETMGDPDTLKAASKVNLIKGACWAEEEGGTNGIGTALALKKPVQISGCEHFCRKLHPWTCSAAPFFSETGEMIGILQMSGASSNTHPHTLGMVVAAVEAIGYQLQERRKSRELSTLTDRFRNIFQTMSDGAIIIDQRGEITQVNPAASRMFGAEVLGCSIDTIVGNDPGVVNLLSNGHSYKDVEVMLETSFGEIHALMTIKPLSHETGTMTGGVIFLNPITKMKKLINHFGGAHATFSFNDIIGQAETLKQTLALAEKAATNNSHIIVQGESGTGKELLAQAIHNQSSRKKGPFLAINCAALPRDLIASELFGYASGAFTGANPKGRPGKFEMAAGGTLLLDEIGDMPLDQQASLLRVLQEKQITRLGSEKVIPVDVRVICATHSNLLAEISKGNFRQDLYYRLNVIKITVPPLRERGDDVLILCEYFLQKIGRKLNLDTHHVAPEVRASLLNYHWPGNIRELENVVEKMIHSADGEMIEVKHLPVEISSTCQHQPPLTEADRSAAPKDKNLKQMLAENERLIILDLLQQHRGNISAIAKAMAVSRNTIYRKMHLYGISKDYLFN